MLFKKCKKYVSFLMVLVFLLLQLPTEAFADTQPSNGNVSTAGITKTALPVVSDLNNGDWSKKSAILHNTQEADMMVRVGDIDDFGLGWKYTTKNFFDPYRENNDGNDGRELWTTIDPFSGKSTSAHYWGSKNDPNDHFDWESANKNEANGVDRIIKTSGEQGPLEGYGNEAKIKATDKEAQITINHEIKSKIQSSNKKFEVKTAKLQMFVDDFQAGEFSDIKYQVKFNGLRIPELEDILNNLKQSGPVGKLITFEIPEKYLDLFRNNDSLKMYIDSTDSDRSEGYAIDFVKLLINPKDMIHEGSISGRVTDEVSGKPIENAYVSVNGKWEGYTNDDGYYNIGYVTSGYACVKAYKAGQYEEQIANVNVVDENDSKLDFKLKKINLDKFIEVNKIVGTNLGKVGEERYKVTLQIDNVETPNIKCDYIIQDEMADEFEVVAGSLAITGTNGPQKDQTMKQDRNELTFEIHDQGPKNTVSASYEIKRKDKYIPTGMYPTSRKPATLNYKFYKNNGNNAEVINEGNVEFPDVKVQLTAVDATSKIDLSKTVEKNQWGLNEEFTVSYKIQPRDIPQNSVPEAMYHKNGVDISIYGVQFEETFPSGISIVDKSNGLKLDTSNSNKIIGDIGNINYTLDTVKHVFKAEPINFWIKLKGTALGDYVLGRNTSFVSYKDINGKDVNPSPSFSPININIYNNDKSTIRTGLFINNQFEERDAINVVKGFNTNLAFEITDSKINQVTVDVNNSGFIKISDVEVYETTDFKKPISNAEVKVSGNTFTIKNLPTNNNNYVVVFKVTALKITTNTISDSIKINDFPRTEKHSIKVVKLPILQ